MVKEREDQKKIAEMYRAWKLKGKAGVQEVLEKRKKESTQRTEQFVTGKKV